MSTSSTLYVICNPDGTFRHKSAPTGGRGSGYDVPDLKPGCLYVSENEANKRRKNPDSVVVPVLLTFDPPFGPAAAPVRPKAASGPILKLVRALKAQGFRDGGDNGHRILNGPAGSDVSIQYQTMDGPEAVIVYTKRGTPNYQRRNLNHAQAWAEFEAGTLFNAAATESLADKLLK